MNNCVICNQPLKLIPAGTSKAGKTYNAFFTCEDRNHKQPYGSANNAPQATTTPNKAIVEPTYQEEKPNWDDINEKKRKDIKWMNALNNACLLLANGKDKTGYTDNSDPKVVIRDMANFIYSLEPTIPTVKNESPQAQAMREGIYNFKPESNIDVSKVPF